MDKYNFTIITDIGSDIPADLALELGLVAMPMNVTVGDRHFTHYADYREMSSKDFYDAMRNGELATTAAVTPIEWEEEIEKHLSGGSDVLVMPFSKGLSSTYENAVFASSELRARYPGRQLEVMDTLRVTSGLILLLRFACQYRAEGRSLSETLDMVNGKRQSICTYFTVEDLGHLRRGGRISAATAVVGSALGIKPVMIVDNEGKLEAISKARGRKNSLLSLLDYISQFGTDLSEQAVAITHGDCIDDAGWFRDELQSRFNCSEVILGEIGPLIGAHTGPGAITVGFIGKNS